MNRRRLSTLAVCAGLLIAAGPATQTPLTPRPGLWEVSRSATGAAAERVCLPDPMILAQWEHRKAACTRIIISQQGSTTTVRYTCVGGGFGQSELTALTPRSLRVETQGIANDVPFAYSIHARRDGACRGH